DDLAGTGLDRRCGMPVLAEAFGARDRRRAGARVLGGELWDLGRAISLLVGGGSLLCLVGARSVDRGCGWGDPAFAGSARPEVQRGGEGRVRVRGRCGGGLAADGTRDAADGPELGCVGDLAV